jgi:hypothetical protein
MARQSIDVTTALPEGSLFIKFLNNGSEKADNRPIHIIFVAASLSCTDGEDACFSY